MSSGAFILIYCTSYPKVPSTRYLTLLATWPAAAVRQAAAAATCPAPSPTSSPAALPDPQSRPHLPRHPITTTRAPPRLLLPRTGPTRQPIRSRQLVTWQMASPDTRWGCIGCFFNNWILGLARTTTAISHPPPLPFHSCDLSNGNSYPWQKHSSDFYFTPTWYLHKAL